MDTVHVEKVRQLISKSNVDDLHAEKIESFFLMLCWYQDMFTSHVMIRLSLETCGTLYANIECMQFIIFVQHLDIVLLASANVTSADHNLIISS